MNIDFDKLQKEVLKAVKKEYGIRLDPYDVRFMMCPPKDRYNGKTKIYLYIFEQEFSVSYADNQTTPADLIMDWDSRLHDYGVDNGQDHILRLRSLAFEEQYRDELLELRENILQWNRSITPDQVDIEVDHDYNLDRKTGFPKYHLFIYWGNALQYKRELKPDEFTPFLAKAIESEIEDKVKSWKPTDL